MDEMAKALGVTREINIAQVPIGNPDGIRPVYCNNVGLQITTWDFRLMFSEVIPKAIPGELSIELRAAVTMNAAQAKGLAIALMQSVKQYEQVNGEIPWPPKAGNIAKGETGKVSQ